MGTLPPVVSVRGAAAAAAKPRAASAVDAAAYEHPEAYCLMTYQAIDGETEVIWNSRDGVTPYVIGLRSGKEARHVNWPSDRCVPDYLPPLGSRIFVDLTEARARQLARANAERLWATYPPSHQQFATVDDLAEMLAGEYLKSVGDGAPDLIEVAG
ncbi:MAG: hypothetical protein ACJ74O_13685 [Frankiaceae bacterium]|jgi:hypothetical protein